jgi:two-component system, sensor histidine kinase and response regulator
MTKPINMIILDDEVNILNACMRLFINEQFGVFVTSDSQKALAAIEGNDVKVVLSDYRMPALSGVEFLSQVKAKNPATMRMLFTGYADVEMAEDAINQGEIYRLIDKPWNDDELLMTVREAIKLFDLRRENELLFVKTQQQNVELKKLDKLKDDFVASISHELRTPLNTMMIVLENIKIGIAGNPESFSPKMHEYLDIIQRSTGRLRAMIDDLLDVFKLESPEFTISPVRAKLQDLMNNEIAAMQAQIDEKKLKLEVNLGEDIYLQVDPRRFGQVIMNLLSNAVKFTDTGGRIGVSVERAGTEAVCRITDTGKGIETKDLELIFDRFYQVATTREGKPQGTGLGLAICRKIIAIHGGSIHAESEIGKGTTFVFKLPAEG